MKKTLLFLTLFIAMLTFGVRAQIPVLTEGFEGTSVPTGWTTIDADQDGHGWELSSVQEDLTGHTGNGSIVSYSYDNGGGGALTPNNWLISPAISLSGTSSLSFWFVVAQAYPSDHYGVYVSTTSATDTSAFTLVYEMTPTSANGSWTQQTVDLTSYAGNTVYIAFRHFDCTDMFLIALDDITVSTVTTDPAIVATPNALNFGIVYLGESAVQTVDVTSYNNTTPISVSVTAPFAVSADSLTFGTTATLPAAGGTLYVKYEPTAAETNSAVMTLTAGTLTATVNLSGTCLDCSALTLPYTETFEATSPNLSCWMLSGDAAWGIGTGDYSTATGSFEGSYNALITHSSTGNVSKLISPVLGTNNGVVLHFAYVMRSWAGDIDELRVYSRASENGAWQQVAEFTDAAASWTVANVAVPGSVYQIAFEMTDNYGYGVGLDSVVFEAMAADFCSPVTSLVVTDITSNSATLSWVDAGNTGATYTIYNMADTSIVATVNDTSYTVNNLAANTNYTFGVQAICATSDATITTVSCLTECASETMPWSENFDNWTSKSPCWSFLSGLLSEGAPTAYSSAWTLNSTYGSYITINGKALTMNLYNTLRYWAVTPIINITSNNAMLSVDVAVSAWSAAEPNYDDNDTLAFLVITENDTTFTLLQALDHTQLNALSNTYTTLYVPVTGYNGQNVRFAIYGGSVSGTSPHDNRIAIDNVAVGEASSCMPVSNLSVSDVTSSGATLTWQGSADSYTVYNMADTSVVQTTTDTTVVISTLNPDTQYTLGVQANCGSEQSVFVTTNITTLVTCPAPANLTVALTPGNGTIATLSWTETGSATAWQLCLNGDTNNLVDVTTNPYDLTGLTPEQALTAQVRANCDVNDQSEWSNLVNFTPTNAYVITVHDGSASNSVVPVYGLWVDDITKSQFIIPASDLTAMQYGTINKLTFYSSTSDVNWGVAEFSVYMTETTETTLSSLADYSSMSQVYAGTLSINNNIMEVTLTNPYLYMGGNLMIGFLQTVSGTYSSSYWIGESVNGVSMGGYGTGITQQNFLPKTTIAYTPGTAPTCFPVTGLTASNVTANQVTLTWSGNAASYSIYEDGDFVANVTDTTYTVTGLAPAADYVFGVRAICSATDSSMISNVAASTECGLITTYPYVQDFSAAPACWMILDADGDGQNWLLYQGTIQSASYNSGALTPDNWLISPQFAIPATGNYEVTWTATAQDQSWPAEHYGIFVSTTDYSDTANFTMLQEWTLGPGLFNPVVDLSNYAGQNIYIALRHFNCTDQFRLSIDDFIVREQAGANQVTINAGPNNPAYGTVAGAGIYTIGDNVTLTATANSGYTFAKWVDENNTILSTNNPYTFVAATDLNLTAIFLNDAGTTYVITVQVNDSTMGTAVGGGTYTAGDQITLTATPFPGYNFVNWTQVSGFGTNVVGTDPNLIITVTSDKTFVANFEVGSGPEPCDVPTGLTVAANGLHNESIDVTWDANAAVSSWNVQYRQQGTTDWNSATTTTNSYTITGLTGLRTYEIQVQANCGGGNVSDWSTSITATTTNVGIDEFLAGSVSLYPNPAREYVDIRIDGDVNVSMMEVFDVFGKLISTVNVVDNPTRINVSNLANGMYFVRVTTEEGVVTKTFVKK